MQEQLWRTPSENSLLAVDTFIGKGYLAGLDRQVALPLRGELKKFDSIRLFRVKKIVFDKEENVNDKLISVYSAIQSIDASVFMLITSDGSEVSFYLGTRSSDNQDVVASQILCKSIQGNFPGSELTNQNTPQIEELFSKITEPSCWTNKSLASVAVTPSPRDEDKEKFVQGLEKFIDTMMGSSYSALVIAKPFTNQELNLRRKGLEDLYTSLSPYAKTSMAYGENYSKAVTQGIAENFSRSLNDSIASSVGTNSGRNYSTSVGESKGDSYNVGGFGWNSGTSNTQTSGISSGRFESKTETHGTTDTHGETKNYSEADTAGKSSTVTLELQNKNVDSLLQKIELQLKRINDCESFGIWECAAYFISDDIETSVIAASTYKALMLGDDTHVDKTHVNIWENPGEAIEYLKFGLHPQFLIESDGCSDQIIRPTNIVSGKELPFLMGIPRKSVDGLTVSTIAEFGRNVISQNAGKGGRKIRIGAIQHMGIVETSRSVDLDLDSFTSHCFVTGSTGSGKSNTTYCLLSQFIENKVPFLVVEPAKGEYKSAFGSLPGINIFTTNPYVARMLKINPFRFNQNIHVLEHIDRLIEIFNVCWEMYAAMPAILKSAVEQVYIDADWDLLNSVYVGVGEPKYPTFNDLLNVLPRIISSSSYSADAKGDYEGALVTRVQSLTNGIYGQIFCDCYDIKDDVLFDQNTIVDLSRVGSSETKSLIMGLLVLKLSEYRMACATGANSQLRHITVMEEAHNLLKNSKNGTAGNSIVAKSVEMISNSIAEMRTYGEGFVIVDQSPTAVDISAIKNTNTKILMRLPEMQDCATAGQSVALNESQIAEMSKLGTGVAIVMQNNWLEAVLVKIDRASDSYEKSFDLNSLHEIKNLKGKVITKMLCQYFDTQSVNKAELNDLIASSSANEYVKDDMRACIENLPPALSLRVERLAFWETLSCLSSAKPILSKLDKDIIFNTKEKSIDVPSCMRWHQHFLNDLAIYTGIEDRLTLRRLEKLLIRHACFTRSNASKYLEIFKTLYV